MSHFGDLCAYRLKFLYLVSGEACEAHDLTEGQCSTPLAVMPPRGMSEES